MARGDLIDVGYGQMASPRTMCKSGFVWRYANTSQEAINTNSDIIEIFPYILRTATNYTPYSNDLRNSYVQITIGSTTTTQYLKSKYNFGNVSPINTKFYLTSEYNSSNPFGYGTPDSTTYVTTRTIDSKTAYGARFTVPHNADGSAPTVSVKWHMTNSSSHSDIEKVESLILDTIPRTSKPTCGNVTLGGSVTINTNRASTSFTHTINIKVGGTTRETFNNVGASQSWSPSYSTYLPIISGTSATATIECITYSGSTTIGTASTTCVITVPNNANTQPTANVAIAKGDSVVPSSWGVYVKGKSKLLVTITSEPKAGTTSTSYTSTANGSTKTGSLSYDSDTQKYKATYTTAELTGSGQVKATVKDGRGFTSSEVTSSYTVVDYANPQITTNTVARCTSNGTLSDEGTYVKYSFAGSISSVSNKNSKTFTLKYKEKSASSWTTIATWSSAYTLNQVDVVFGSGNIDITKEYVFRFEATDQFGTVYKEVEVGTVADIFNFNPSGKSMAIGGVSNRGSNEKALDVYLPSYLRAGGQFIGASGSSWVKARDVAMVKNTASSGVGYRPLISSKTTNGEWSIGSYEGNGDNLLFSYTTDTNYNNNNNISNRYTIGTNGYFSGSCASADTATNATNATNATQSNRTYYANTLEAFDGRITNANTTHYYNNDKAHCKLLIVSSSMTSNKPMADGYILCFDWDNSGAWVGQFFVPNNQSDYLQFRGCTAAGTFGTWKTIATNNDKGCAMLTLTSNWSFTATAWTNKTVEFSGRGTLIKASDNFESVTNGIKCKFGGWVQVSGTVNTDKSNQFDAVLLKGTTTIAKTTNTGGRCSTVTGIVQVANGDIIYLAFNSSNTSGTIYANTNLVVTRVS